MANVVTPPWMMKVLVTTLITAAVAGAFGWARSTSIADTRQDTAIEVLKSTQENVDEDIDDIKATLRRIEDKIDRALEAK